LKRLAEFLRSVVPADPSQLLFLAGIVCLIASHGLRWWPEGLVVAHERLAGSLGQQVQLVGLPRDFSCGGSFGRRFIFSQISLFRDPLIKEC